MGTLRFLHWAGEAPGISVGEASASGRCRAGGGMGAPGALVGWRGAAAAARALGHLSDGGAIIRWVGAGAGRPGGVVAAPHPSHERRGPNRGGGASVRGVWHWPVARDHRGARFGPTRYPSGRRLARHAGDGEARR